MQLSHLQVKWFKGDEELKPSDRVKMEVTPKHAVLTVKKADKDDEAPYRVEMENPSGKDQADLTAQVKDKDRKLPYFFYRPPSEGWGKVIVSVCSHLGGRGTPSQF